jgi:hypothetical protein
MKYKYIILLFILLFANNFSNAQYSFTQKYFTHGAAMFNIPFRSPFGFYMVGGSVDSITFYNKDIALIRTDTTGNILWTKNYITGPFNTISAGCVTSDGSIVLAGEIATIPGVNADALIMRIDTNGNAVWATTIGGSGHDWAVSVCESDDGGFVVAANSYSFNSTAEHIYLFKLDNLGNKIWSRLIGQDSVLYDIKSVRQTSDHGFILAGEISPPYAMIIIKTDSLGIPEWRKYYDKPIEDWAFDAVETVDSSYVIYGTSRDGDDPTIIKTDLQGNIRWSRIYAGPISTITSFRHFQLAHDGNYLFNGYVYDSLFNSSQFMAKIDTGGNILWTVSFDSTTQTTMGQAPFEEFPDGSFLIIGYDYSDTSAILKKTNSYNSCTFIQKQIFDSSGTFTVDTGITYTTPVDSVFHPAITETNLNITDSLECWLVVISGIENNSFVNEINVYPNPCNEQLIIRSSDGLEKQFYFHNNIGQMIYEKKIHSDELIVNTSNWENGVYFVSVISEKNKLTKSICVMH